MVGTHLPLRLVDEYQSSSLVLSLQELLMEKQTPLSTEDLKRRPHYRKMFKLRRKIHGNRCSPKNNERGEGEHRGKDSGLEEKEHTSQFFTTPVKLLLNSGRVIRGRS